MPLPFIRSQQLLPTHAQHNMDATSTLEFVSAVLTGVEIVQEPFCVDIKTHGSDSLLRELP